MPVTVEDLERAIRAAFPVSHLDIEDQSSGCGSSYAILLVSEVRVRNELELLIVNVKWNYHTGFRGKDYSCKT